MGVLDFDSAVLGVNGVIWKHDLKTAVTTANAPYSTVTPSGTPQHDSSGFKPSTGSGEYDLSGLLDAPGGSSDSTLLDTGFTLAFDIETKHFAWDSVTVNAQLSPSFSEGNAYTNNTSVIFSSKLEILKKLNLGSNGVVTKVGSLAGGATIRDNISFGLTGGTISSPFANSYDDSVTRVVITVFGGFIYQGTDGMMQTKRQFTDTTDIWDAFTFGAEGTNFVDAYISNLVMSSNATVFVSDLNIMCHSDSMFSDSKLDNNTTAINQLQDKHMNWRLHRFFTNNENPLSQINIATNGGDTLVQYTGQGAGANLLDKIASQVPADSDLINLTCGTNDMNQGGNFFVESEFVQGLKDYVTQAVIQAPSVRQIFVWVPPPQGNMTASQETAQGQINAAVLAEVAINPMLSLSVNAFEVMGSDNTLFDAIETIYTPDDTHLGPESTTRIGDVIAETIYNFIYGAGAPTLTGPLTKPLTRSLTHPLTG